MALERGGYAIGSEGYNLLKLFNQHLGDSRCIECTHQTAKDILRSGRNFQRAIASRMNAVINSPALKQRKLNFVPLPWAGKVQSGTWDRQLKSAFKWKTAPEKHKMHSDFQRLMLPNRGSSAWPSPTPASMYQAIASTEFLFGNFAPQADDLEEAWLSVLCGKPGSIIAHKPSGQLLFVLAHSEFSFLSWRLKVHVGDDDARLLGAFQPLGCKVFLFIALRLFSLPHLTFSWLCVCEA